MPESTCLHIQDHESGPIRVVDIPWVSVRIGRAAFCEVRLTSDDLADEACRLYRRGRSWHLVPGGGKGKIMVEGRSVTAMCSLPFDVTFRVGRHCLTLRQDRSVDPDWEMYPGRAPAHRNRTEPRTKDVRAIPEHTERTASIIESQPVAEASRKPDWRDHETATRPGPSGEYAGAASVKDRWETRWRAAGAEIKARGDRSPVTREPKGAAFKAGFDTVPLKEAPIPRPQPAAPPRIEPSSRPIPTVPPLTKFEPISPIFVERPRSEPAIERDSLAGSPAPDASEPIGEVEAPSEPEFALGSHGSSPSRDFSDSHGEVEAPSEPEFAFGSHGGSPSSNVSESDARNIEPPSPLHEFEPGSAEKPIADESSYTTSVLEDEPHSAADDASWYEAPALPSRRQGSPSRQSSASRKQQAKDGRTIDSDRPKRPPGRAKKPAEGRGVASPLPRKGGEPRSVGFNRPEPEPSLKFAQMPSAKDILATCRPREKTQPTSLATRAPGREASPTLSREPSQWTLPAWIAGPPAAAFFLAVGIAGCILSFGWTTDSYSVAIMTKLLMAADRRPQRGPLPESVGPPDGSWTRSTAQHLAHWAIFMSLIEPGKEPRPEDVRALAEKALEVSPLNPTARLALAQLDQREPGATLSPGRLGMSRDLVSLSWCARRLLASGNKEEALNMYKKALAVLTPDEPFKSAIPRFSDDPNVPRYLLPGEDRVRAIVDELISRKAWTFREWSAVLPKAPASSMAAARLLKEKGEGEADELLDLLLAGQEPVVTAKRPGAIALAARAEAFAFKYRWKDSKQAYRRAIELIDDETIKRSWWFNLADVALRLEDESQRQTALRAALAVSTPDDISRRATDSQRVNSVRPTGRPRSVKAN